MSIQSEITRITNKRDASFTAVANKGVTVPSGSTIDDLPSLIGAISTASPTYSVTKTLTNVTTTNDDTEVLQGNSFFADLTPTTGYQITSITVMMGGVDITSQVFTPGTGPKTITQNGTYNASDDYLSGYSSVTVNVSGGSGGGAISVVDTLDSHGGTIREITAVDISNDTVTADKLLQGYTAHNASGQAITGTYTPSAGTLQTKTVSPTESVQTVTPDSGYDGLSSVEVGAISSTYVGSGIDRNDSTDLTVSGATVAVPAGYYATGVSKSVASGSATTPATSITANPSISISSAGLITVTASTSTQITPTVSSGYISSGTAGTVTVSGSNTEQLSTQAATTITPTESSQTAVAAGKFTTGAVTVGAISSTYVGSGIDRNDSSSLSVSGATVTAPAGYYSQAASKSVASGTTGTPTATKSSVTNHSVSVTPSVTNTTGYITGGTINGSAVTVSASELVSGNLAISANGTGIDVAEYSTVSVAVPVSSGKAVQIASGVGRASSSAYTAVSGQTLTVGKTGTYHVYWVGYRSSTSGTSGSALYIGDSEHSSGNQTTFNSSYANVQNVHLTNVSLTKDQVITVRARSRGNNYYMYIMNLTIIEA